MSKTYEEIKAEMEMEINEYFNPSERMKGVPTLGDNTTAIGYGTSKGEVNFRKFYPKGKYVVVGADLLSRPDHVHVYDGDEIATIEEGTLGIPVINRSSKSYPKIGHIAGTSVTLDGNGGITVQLMPDTGCTPVDLYNKIYHPEENNNDFNDL